MTHSVPPRRSSDRSGRTSGVNAVTIAVSAGRPARPTLSLRRGRIYLSRPIGALKLLYLSEMGIEIDKAEAVDLLERPGNEAFQRVPWAAMTDVSGHGLLGAVMQMARSEEHTSELQSLMRNSYAVF